MPDWHLLAQHKNKKTRKIGVIYSKLTTGTLERCHCFAFPYTNGRNRGSNTSNKTALIRQFFGIF